MSSAEDDEVTQVAPPQLVPAGRPTATAAEPTQDLPAPPLVGREELPDDHDFRELSGPTEVSSRPALPRSGSLPDLSELTPTPGERTGELPAPPTAGRASAYLAGPTPIAAGPGAIATELTEPTEVTGVATEPTDIGTASTQVAGDPGDDDDSATKHSEELTTLAADLLAAQARAKTMLASAPAVITPPPAAPRHQSLPDLPDLPDLPAIPAAPVVPEPPRPAALERSPSRPIPAAIQSARQTAKVSRAQGRSSLADAGMRQEEITRGHAFIKLLVIIIGVAGSMMFVIDGDPVAEAIAAMGLVYTLGAFAWFLYRVRDVAGYQVRPLSFLIASTMLAAYTMVYLWGVSSPMPVIFALSIAFIAHSANPTIALSGYLSCALAQLALTLLLATGVVHDRSLIPLASLGTAELLVSQFVVHSMYFSAYLVARYNRRMALQALVQLERAAVEVARRDMLLQEARQELSNALRVGSSGRYTGQQMGRYRLGVLLGHGAVGEVYEAVNLDTTGVAAIKLLHGHATADERQVQRFLREAEHASQLRSPYVVQVFDYGHGPDGAHYLAMERLRGSNLAEHLRVYERMPLSDIVTLVDHVAAGLQAAWEAGIVHRDIKPQNIFRSQEPHGPATWKILDFGVSKMAHQNNTLTQGNIIGTPSYMAPEQVEGQQLDHRADLFALAAVAYRALTGRPAFGGDKLPVVLYRVVYGMPEAPSSMVAVPADVDLVFARGLAKRPEDRYANTAELARSLALAARGQLTEAMRSQARRLVRKHPWGTLLRPQDQRSSRSA